MTLVENFHHHLLKTNLRRKLVEHSM